jgi:hypothetical protein
VHRACNHKLSEEAVKKLKEYVEAGGYLFTEDWGLTDILARAWPQLVGPGSYLPEGEVDVAPASGATTHPLLRGVFVSEKKIIKESDIGEKDAGSGKGGPKTVSEDVRKKIEESVKKPDNKWKVDDESPYIEVKDKNKVTILMASQKVGELSSGHNTVALTFGGPYAYGKGEATGGRKDRTQLRGDDEESNGPGKRIPGVLKGRVLHVLSHFARQHAKEDEFALQNLALNFLLEARARRSVRGK